MGVPRRSNEDETRVAPTRRPSLPFIIATRLRVKLYSMGFVPINEPPCRRRTRTVQHCDENRGGGRDFG